MIWTLRGIRKRERQMQWHRFFAIRPRPLSKNRRAALMFLERRREAEWYDWEYRLPQPKDVVI